MILKGHRGWIGGISRGKRKLEVSSESEKCHVRMKHLLPAGFNQIVAGEDEEMGKEGSD